MEKTTRSDWSLAHGMMKTDRKERRGDFPCISLWLGLHGPLLTPTPALAPPTAASAGSPPVTSPVLVAPAELLIPPAALVPPALPLPNVPPMPALAVLPTPSAPPVAPAPPPASLRRPRRGSEVPVADATTGSRLPTILHHGGSRMRKARDRIHVRAAGAREDFALSNHTGPLGDVPGGSGSRGRRTACLRA